MTEIKSSRNHDDTYFELKQFWLFIKWSFLLSPVAGKALPSELSSGQGSTQESETATSQSEAEDAGGIPRANLPTIQGGLNCSISDILEASGYGTETDFIVDNE